MLLCMNQLVNMAAKMSYMVAGAHKVPMVVRGIIGRNWGQGAQHSQALHSYFMHIPGLKVFAPTTPYDAKGCLTAGIRDNNPVIMLEHRLLHPITGHVPEEVRGTVWQGAYGLSRRCRICRIAGAAWLRSRGMRLWCGETKRLQRRLAALSQQFPEPTPISFSAFATTWRTL
jgi:hypothetical protein